MVHMEWPTSIDSVHWQILIAGCAVLTAGLFAAATWYLTRERDRKWAAVLMAGLRWVALITAAALLWVVFWGRGQVEETVPPELRDAARLVLLQDASTSMEFPGTERDQPFGSNRRREFKSPSRSYSVSSECVQEN